MNKVAVKREIIADDITVNLDDDNICELEHLRKLFIGGLAPYTTEEGLKEFYSKWGNVVDVVVMRDPNTKRSRGFGFITYTKSHMVDKAQENRPHIIDGKTVEAKRALPRPERQASESKNISVKKLFVGGLKDNHDEACLTEYFSQFGKVVSVKILLDKTTGKRRGFAFIEFDDYDAVDKTLLQKTHSIKYVLVDVKKSVYSLDLQKKNAQKQILSNKMQQPPQQQRPQQDTPNSRPMPGGPNRQPPPMSNGMNYMPPPQVPPYQQAPPPTYNQWGPPQSGAPGYQGYGGYQQPSMPQGPQQMSNWGYPSAPNNWNGPPPPSNPQQPPPTWQQVNQWGPPPAAMPPPGPMPPNNMPPPSMQPPTNWQQPPPGPPTSVPPPHQQQHLLPPQQQQSQPPNFGTGYQQNYGGGPTKHPNNTNNRMNPYGGPPNANNAYSNNIQIPPGNTYNNYMTGPPNPKPSINGPESGHVPKPMINANVNNPHANKYRR